MISCRQQNNPADATTGDKDFKYWILNIIICVRFQQRKFLVATKNRLYHDVTNEDVTNETSCLAPMRKTSRNKQLLLLKQADTMPPLLRQ
mmetsp:Transcript_7594/g.22240  ORF Transcript_7594/g.22240 Transcript_7594/m.22240 type:complete len:90 (+) Transcript_7594:2436-2705(+)